MAEVNVYPALPALAYDTAVTLVANHTANLAFNPSAFAFVTRPLLPPAGVESYVTSYNGITLRVVRGYDIKYKKEMLSMDILYGYKTMYRNWQSEHWDKEELGYGLC
nr:P22 phage major capsid protein family protein [Dehalobacter restrictus]